MSPVFDRVHLVDGMGVDIGDEADKNCSGRVAQRAERIPRHSGKETQYEDQT